MGILSTLKDHGIFAAIVAGVSGMILGYFIARQDLNHILVPVSEKVRKGFQNVNRSEENFQSKSMLRRQTLMALEKAFRVNKNDLEIICDAFLKELELGLVRSQCEVKKGCSEPASSLPMLPSYVDRLPTGSESGVYLAVDFGGTHVRIVKVILDDEKGADKKGTGSSNLPTKYRMIQSKVIIPDEMKHGSGYSLFDFIAEGLAEFLKQHPMTNFKHATLNSSKKINHKQKGGSGTEKEEYSVVPLGFTFSFPIEQTGIDSGTIMLWNKDFKCDDVIGQDPVKLLQSSINKKGLGHIKVAALVNDTVGTLVAHAYEHTQTMVSLILGTGSNAAYIEDIDRIKKFHPEEGINHSQHMLINTEFGAFYPKEEEKKKILPRTRFDDVVDQASRNPGHQVFEKMISGYYLGEIVRTVLIDLISSGKLFKEANWSGSSSDKYGLFGTQHSFDTSYMSRIERDHSSELADTKSVFEDIFEIYDSSLSDRQLVKFVCELAAIRSARLAAATVGGILAHLGLAKMLFHTRQPITNEGTVTALFASKIHSSNPSISAPNDHVVVAIDGSLFEHYPHYGNRMMDALRELFGARADAILLSLARDGSGLGAALIAAIASDAKRPESIGSRTIEMEVKS